MYIEIDTGKPGVKSETWVQLKAFHAGHNPVGGTIVKVAQYRWKEFTGHILIVVDLLKCG